MDRDVLQGAVGVEQVEFVVRPVKNARTTRWSVTCACGDTGVASNRVMAGKAAAIHARSKHDGAAARVVMGGQDPKTMVSRSEPPTAP